MLLLSWNDDCEQPIMPCTNPYVCVDSLVLLLNLSQRDAGIWYGCGCGCGYRRRLRFDQTNSETLTKIKNKFGGKIEIRFLICLLMSQAIVMWNGETSRRTRSRGDSRKVVDIGWGRKISPIGEQTHISSIGESRELYPRWDTADAFKIKVKIDRPICNIEEFECPAQSSTWDTADAFKIKVKIDRPILQYERELESAGTSAVTVATPLPAWFIETESDDDLLDEDEDVEEDNDHESEVPEHAEPVGQKIEASPAPKEAERQLSKKERRKKELAELEALLADFGSEQKEKGPDDLPDVAHEKIEGDQQGKNMEKKNGATSEPKSAKKKKKKDKASKEVKESEDQPNNVDASIGPEETGGAGQVEDVSTVDIKERLKRVASAKKKKSGKEPDAAARAAAIEAAARSSKLAAAKKKEKSHYNQQPMR
ncbi:putative syntaxin-32-like isoform 1 [Capsicum annuum]|nr:putative syntaxin-32-like isoform 1 [Capsicum annuum]